MGSIYDIRKVKFASREIRIPASEGANEFAGGVLILPSLNSFLGVTDERLDEFMEFLLCCRDLCTQLNRHKVAIKFHPGLSRKGSNTACQKVFLKVFPNGIIINESENVEILLNQFQCIVGDVCTSLIHATYRPGKIVVSIDMENSGESCVMKNYEGINYIKISDFDSTMSFNKLIYTTAEKKGLSFKFVLEANAIEGKNEKGIF